jgi:chemotaxis protein MotB
MSKENASEWISISDLMAGVLGIVILLLVTVILQKIVIDLKYNQEKQEYIKAKEKVDQLEKLEKERLLREEKIRLILMQIKKDIISKKLDDLIYIDDKNFKITLKSNSFESGSACVKDQMKNILDLISIGFLNINQIDQGIEILIEGHSDNLPVLMPVNNFTRNCTIYDDNYTLSAARARETRNHMLKKLSNIAHRMIVGGYGDSRPLKEFKPNDPQQRRIEIRLRLADL